MRAAAAAAMVLVACGGGSDPTCPNDLPSSCVQPAPSYKTDVQPVMSARCLSCHAPGGQEAALPFTTYSQVFANRAAILDQTYACRMPPAGSPPPTAPERALLLHWLVCGAPNN